MLRACQAREPFESGTTSTAWRLASDRPLWGHPGPRRRPRQLASERYVNPVASVEPSSDLLPMTVPMGIARNPRSGGMPMLLPGRQRWWGGAREAMGRAHNPPAVGSIPTRPTL